MRLIKIDEYASKEEKLNQILEYLQELKNAFAEVIDEFDSGDSEEETVNLLTGALDTVEDAHDVILDVIDELED